jgi:ketosteroid isomerase-like protein
MAEYDLMRNYLDRIVAGDFVGAEEHYADDITVHFSGWKDVYGKDEYNAALGEMMGMVDSLQVEEHDLLVSDDHAVVLNDWHIIKDDRDERVNHVIVYHTAGDKITEIWVVAENQAMMSELMGG